MRILYGILAYIDRFDVKENGRFFQLTIFII